MKSYPVKNLCDPNLCYFAYSGPEYQIPRQNYYQIQHSNEAYSEMNTSQIPGHNGVYNAYVTNQMPSAVNIYGFQGISRNTMTYVCGNGLVNPSISVNKALPVVTNSYQTQYTQSSFTRIQDEGYIVTGYGNYVWPHYNDDPGSLSQNVTQNPERVATKKKLELKDIKYKHATVNIYLFGYKKVNDVYDIFYICDPRCEELRDPCKKELISGKAHIEIKFKDVKNAFPGISLLKVKYLNERKSSKENEEEGEKYPIEGDTLDIWVNTNKKGEKYVIQFLFMEGDQEKFRVNIRLKTGKEEQRKSGKDLDNKRKKGYFIKKNKEEIIKDFLDIEVKNNWELFKRCPKLNKLNKEDMQEISKELRKKKVTKLNGKESIKEIIVILHESKIDDKSKINLLILCFNKLYNCILNNADHKGMIGYLNEHKNFLTKYNIGYSRENDIVIMEDDDKDQRKEESKCHDEECKKRKCPEEYNNVDHYKKRTKISQSEGNVLKQTDKNSEFEVLLVDPFVV